MAKGSSRSNENTVLQGALKRGWASPVASKKTEIPAWGKQGGEREMREFGGRAQTTPLWSWR